jgi:asparagine synthase (glutamine-hydrolysing)
MPGISLLHGDRKALRGNVTELFDAISFLDSYRSRTEVRTDDLLVGHTGYPGYPIRRFETDDAIVLLEGCLYGTEDVDAALQDVVRLLDADQQEALADWIRRDGLFLVLVYRQATGEIEVLTDPFRRLPVYATSRGEATICSRELKFVREGIDRGQTTLELDRLGAAQQLTFGYPLGTRTLFEDVRCLPPASRTRIDSDGRLDISRLSQHDFGAESVAVRSVDENAAELVSRFTAACRRRHSENGRNIVSLSGGLDSRAVAGAYHHAGLSGSAATFDTRGGTPGSDVWVAARVADALDLDWRCYSIDAHDVSEEHRVRLLDMKQGLNYAGMAFILDFYEQLRADFPDATYVTGDGGQMGLTDLKPPKELAGESELLEYVVDANTQIPLEKAAATAGVSPETVRESILARLRSYPETEPGQKYAHFILREQGFNYLVHGEDRNRYYLWSVSPFYSLPFFEYAVRCPDDHKHGRELYSAFLEQMAPSLLDITYSDFDAPITSLEYRFKNAIDTTLSKYPDLRRQVVRYLRDDTERSQTVAERITQQLTVTDLVPLSEHDVADIAAKRDSYRLSALYFLDTLMWVVAGVNESQEPIDRPVM